jgi:hypothetical protein
MSVDEVFPRPLREVERDILLWLLPSGRQGYDAYRRLFLQWNVVAMGRRGAGNYLLAPPGARIDLESPLPQVLALGMIETESQTISATVREKLEDQVEFEIVATRGEGEPKLHDERRRWSLSYWQPGETCPICGDAIREVHMATTSDERIVLAICGGDRRIWIYSQRSQINHLIPPTNFYNELMLHKNIRDPRRALDPGRLFTELTTFSDSDLTRAFRSYNQIRTKLVLEGRILLSEEKQRTFLRRIAHLFTGELS